MTAVAAPLSSSFSNNTSKIGWNSTAANGGSSYPNNNDASAEDSKMFAPGPQRKTAQRQNSSSSLASTTSSTSTIAAAPPAQQANGTAAGDAGSWAVRKKPTRGLWPPGKAEPATGITTARPQPVSSSSTSGPTASSAISALHGPMLPSQQAANGTSQQNGTLRNGSQQQAPEPPAILHLTPINGTFERKTITVPYYPDVLRIGRQTNQKTIPTPLNGYFDSKVLSRQHAEVYATSSHQGQGQGGRIFIKDVKSSNGTFVNGMRLSAENKESEPRELREQDVLELGIDIVSEDQKTVVHHKVAAKVEYAGVYGHGQQLANGVGGADALGNFLGELDPSAGGGGGMMVNGQQALKRTGSQNGLNGRGAVNIAGQQQQALHGQMMMTQPGQMRNWLNPITTEHIVKKLNAEMKMAMQQSQDLARARKCIEGMLGNDIAKTNEKESKKNSFEKHHQTRPSPIKAKSTDLKTHFSEPPAPPPAGPPPQAPLPEKPDVARALADPAILPLLRRSDTTKVGSASSSPTRTDHSSDILRLCEELKLARGELSSQAERMKGLEESLERERRERASAEERAQMVAPSTAGTDSSHADVDADAEEEKHDSPTSATARQSTSTAQQADLQAQLERLQATMDGMKMQMEAYRRRAESAESERDEARQSLAQMVEKKRADNARAGSRSRSRPALGAEGEAGPDGHEERVETTTSVNGTLGHQKKDKDADGSKSLGGNGSDAGAGRNHSISALALLKRAGLNLDAAAMDDESAAAAITPDQARLLQSLLNHEIIGPAASSADERSAQAKQGSSFDGSRNGSGSMVMYHGRPLTGAAMVVVLGVCLMGWMNSWPARVER